MLTKKDLELIGALFDSRLDVKPDVRSHAHQLCAELRSVLKTELGASENRMIQRMDKGFSSILEKLRRV